jgi:hypothetical protein
MKFFDTVHWLCLANQNAKLTEPNPRFTPINANQTLDDYR